jgi:hypothetical protein
VTERLIARVASISRLSPIASRLLTKSETVVWMVVAARSLLLNPALDYCTLQLAIGHCIELAGRADLAPLDARACSARPISLIAAMVALYWSAYGRLLRYWLRDFGRRDVDRLGWRRG